MMTDAIITSFSKSEPTSVERLLKKRTRFDVMILSDLTAAENRTVRGKLHRTLLDMTRFGPRDQTLIWRSGHRLSKRDKRYLS